MPACARSIMVFLTFVIYILRFTASFHQGSGIRMARRASFMIHDAYPSLGSGEDFVTRGVYNGEEIDGYCSRHPLKVWERCVDIGSPILGWWIQRKYDKATDFMRSPSERERILNERAEDLKDAIVQGKSIVFIKSGQALSLRPDLVKSPEYVRELTKLQDEVGSFPTHIAMDIIQKELQCDNASELFHFDPVDPIASASIGQVFKATVKSTGQQVAVKVQRPDAAETTPLDMYILRTVARLLRRRYKTRSNLEAIADEFGAQIYEELNYEKEAANCLKFKGLYGHIPGIFVPGVDLDLTRRRVLTMEWVDGDKGPWEEGGEKMLTVGLQCSVLQLLGTGYFHSDPHRGNLLRTPKGDLAYLDFGMMSDVPADRRFALIGTVLGLVNKDIPLVIDNLKKLNFLPDETNTGVVVDALNDAFMRSTTGGKGSASTLNFTTLNKNINEMSYLLPISLPPFYTLIIRTLTILEGLALSVDPSFRLVKGAYPFIAKQILLNQGNTSDASSQREMNQLLSSIMVDPDTQRIRWGKLEQFVSISAFADKAVEGDFGALKQAQSRADLMKTYSKQEKGKVEETGVGVGTDAGFSSFGSSSGSGGEGDEDNVRITQDLVLNVLDFLLSPSGRFIREPLVNEAVDTVDALGLTTVSVLSLLSNGLVPPPAEAPERERVLQVINLVGALAENKAAATATGAEEEKEIGEEAKDGRAQGKRMESFFQQALGEITAEVTGEVNDNNIVSRNIKLLLDGSAVLKQWITDPPNDEARQQVDAILTRAAPLLRSVLGKLLSRSVKRTTQQLVTPRTVERTLPGILQVVESLISMAPKDSSSSSSQRAANKEK